MSKKVLVASSALLTAMLLSSIISSVAATELSQSFNRTYIVWAGTTWTFVKNIPILIPWPAVGRLEVWAALEWWPSWGFTIGAGKWIATAMYRGDDFPIISPLCITYFKMVVETSAAPARGGSYYKTYVWEFPPSGTQGEFVYLYHSMEGQIGQRCFGASVKVTLTVHVTSVFGGYDATISTTAYAP